MLHITVIKHGQYYTPTDDFESFVLEGITSDFQQKLAPFEQEILSAGGKATLNLDDDTFKITEVSDELASRIDLAMRQ